MAILPNSGRANTIVWLYYQDINAEFHEEKARWEQYEDDMCRFWTNPETSDLQNSSFTATCHPSHTKVAWRKDNGHCYASMDELIN